MEYFSVSRTFFTRFGWMVVPGMLYFASVGHTHDVPSDLFAPVITPCKRCPVVHSSGLDACWDDLLDHFAEQAEISVNRYALALQFVTRWKAYHSDKADLYTTYTEDRYQAVLDRLFPAGHEEAEDNHGPLDKQDLTEIFKLVLNRSSLHDATYADQEWPMPTLQCPVPCEYHGEIWKTLFIVTALAFSLSLLLLAAHVCWKTNRSDNHILLVTS